jgi:hypothetical protein
VARDIRYPSSVFDALKAFIINADMEEKETIINKAVGTHPSSGDRTAE